MPCDWPSSPTCRSRCRSRPRHSAAWSPDEVVDLGQLPLVPRSVFPIDAHQRARRAPHPDCAIRALREASRARRHDACADCQALGVVLPRRNPVQPRLGPDPQPAFMVAQRSPHQVVAQTIRGCVALPAILANPALQPVADNTDPDRAFAIDKQILNLKSREPVALGHHAPAALLPHRQRRPCGVRIRPCASSVSMG